MGSSCHILLLSQTMNINENVIRLALKVSLIVKSFFAILEIFGGLIFYFVSQNYIVNFIYAITQDELSQDSNDFIASHLVSFSNNLFPSTKHFIAFYFLSHGIVKMIVIIGLLKNKLWAYPTSIIVFVTFIIYQFYRFYFTHSIWLLILTMFDILIIWLVGREYIFNKNKK